MRRTVRKYLFYLSSPSATSLYSRSVSDNYPCPVVRVVNKRLLIIVYIVRTP